MVDESLAKQGGRVGEVSVESGERATVGHEVLGRSRATLSGLQGRHSGEEGEPQRLQDTPIVVC